MLTSVVLMSHLKIEAGLAIETGLASSDRHGTLGLVVARPMLQALVHGKHLIANFAASET